MKITTGYQPGVIGRVTQMQIDYYASHHGFGAHFERRIATELAELVGRLDDPRNAIFCSVIKGQIVGSISVDGQQVDPNTARMRWFITDAEYTGRGIGRTLIERALRHCETQGQSRVVLSSFEGLDPARALYESFGFKLMAEQPGQQYGTEVLEQEFERIAAS